jgi:hypothetical protein
VVLKGAVFSHKFISLLWKKKNNTVALRRALLYSLLLLTQSGLHSFSPSCGFEVTILITICLHNPNDSLFYTLQSWRRRLHVCLKCRYLPTRHRVSLSRRPCSNLNNHCLENLKNLCNIDLIICAPLIFYCCCFCYKITNSMELSPSWETTSCTATQEFPNICFCYGPGVDSASNRNEYQESSRRQRAAGVWGWQPHHHLWADCLENVGTSTSHNPMGLHGLL